MNIASGNTVNECTSCQMCAAVCPTSAININQDKKGFYRPYISVDKCVDCGLCVQVCYKFDKDIRRTYSLSGKTIYGAQSKSKESLECCSSGGIADVLAHYLISIGYTCIGVCYDNDKNIAYHKVASLEKDVLGFRGSKYIQSYTFPAFKELIQKCRDIKFAVFGLPCQIYAIRKYLDYRKVATQHILIDMYCHGTPSGLIWKKYIEEVKTLTQITNLNAVNFRSKVKGWGNFVITLEGCNGHEKFISNNKKDEFYTLFFSDMVLNESCYECKLRSTLEYADLRIGDFWGKAYVGNRSGVSAVSVVSEIGEKIFKGIQSDIFLQTHKYDDFLPYQSYGKVYCKNDKLSSLIFDGLRDNNTSLKDIVKLLYRNQTVKQKLKRYIKALIRLFPQCVINIVKKLYYKF